MMEQYFWEVSLTGWASVAIAYALMREKQRKEKARRRAQFAAVTVALRGVADGMQAFGPAATKAGESMKRFGEQMRESAYRSNQPHGPAPKRRRG